MEAGRGGFTETVMFTKHVGALVRKYRRLSNFLCAHMHKHVHICAPPLPSHVFYQGDVSGNQRQSESQDFPAPYLVNWRTGNAPVNDNICPTIALRSHRYF